MLSASGNPTSELSTDVEESCASPDPRIRVMVVDDHPIVRDGVQAMVKVDQGIQVVASAGSARGAFDVCSQVQPDVILLDLRLPDMLATEAITRLRSAARGVKIIIFTAHASHAALKAAMQAGADGCLIKDSSTLHLAQAIRDVVAGRQVIDPRLGSRPALQLRERLSALNLTRREYEVLRLVATGKTNGEIAQDLSLTRNTVKTYLQYAMQKLGARNRVEAIGKAQEALLL